MNEFSSNINSETIVGLYFFILWIIIIFVLIIMNKLYGKYKKNRYLNQDSTFINVNQSSNSNNINNYSNNYLKTEYLFTRYESNFFKLLLPIATKYNLYVFPKIRLADIVHVNQSNKQFYTWFNKIKAKHIDFVLCDYTYCKPVILIELNDNSHYRQDRIIRDNFINKLMTDLKIPFLQVWQNDIIGLENSIVYALNENQKTE